MDFVAYAGRTLDTVTQAETLRSFHGVSEDLARFEAAAGMVGIVRALSGGDEADRRVFNLLYNALDMLETCDSGFENIEAAFGIKLSILAGYAPQLDACLACATDLDEASEPLHFAPDLGGVLCRECRPATGDAFPLAPGTLVSLRTLVEQPIRHAPAQAGPGGSVLRVVRSHVLAHAPGNTLVGPRLALRTQGMKSKQPSVGLCRDPSAWAVGHSAGRLRPEPPDGVRNDFQRDRDRIIHAKAFRRLMHKTQVFISPDGDHYRTRLTHTLEMMQISRTIARALGLNEDLTEAISLGHDLGHTPFGHTGEEALSRALATHGRTFRHNEHSLRVVDNLENLGNGLNLTYEVRDGIRNHTGKEYPSTREGEIVRIADRIAYVNHDVDDALRAGIISSR